MTDADGPGVLIAGLGAIIAATFAAGNSSGGSSKAPSKVLVSHALHARGTMRFGSTAKVPAECKLKYYRISECVAQVCQIALHGCGPNVSQWESTSWENTTYLVICGCSKLQQLQSHHEQADFGQKLLACTQWVNANPVRGHASRLVRCLFTCVQGPPAHCKYRLCKGSGPCVRLGMLTTVLTRLQGTRGWKLCLLPAFKRLCWCQAICHLQSFTYLQGSFRPTPW